jgi:hypothetical protein
MQRSTKTVVSALGLLGLGAVGYVGYKGTVKVLKADPLRELKREVPNELPREVAMLMKETEFKRIENGKPSARCFVREMRIANNRQVYDLTGIENGKITWKGVPYEFRASQGNWNGFAKILNVNGSVNLKGPDFDLTSQQLGYDENRRQLDLPQSVKGRAYGGELTVASFTYNMDKKTFVAGKGSWKGKLPQNVVKQSPEVTSNKVWDFDFDEVQKSDKNPSQVIYTKARATDGEVILISPKMIHDEKTDMLTASGGVRYFSPKANVIADKIVVYRKEKRAMLIGNVTMLVKPKDRENEKAKEEILLPMQPVIPDSISDKRPPAPDTDEARKKRDELIRSGKNIREYPLMITASQIEYWYKKGERRANISGNPQARQELPEGGWRYAWSHTAQYDGEKELLTLESKKDATDVVLKNSLGDELLGAWGRISTKDGDDSYEFRKGKAKITTRDEDDEIGGGTKPPPPTKTGSGISGPIRRV